MKKNYILALTAFAFSVLSVNAQFTEDFDALPIGSYHGGNWSSWSGAAGGEDVLVSNAYSFNGTKSGLIAGNGNQDAILRLGNKTTGVYQVSFQVYIPTGKSGYMNFQGNLSAAGGAGANGNGIFNSPNLIFNNVMSPSGAAGSGGAYANVGDPTAVYTWSYPQATWFPVVINFNMDADNWTMTINGTALSPQPFAADGILGGIDFYSFDPNNEIYIDAIVYQDVLSIDEQTRNLFSVYPNPVRDYLNLNSTSIVDMVEVYDILGHTILSVNPGIVSPKIDMSALSSGSYFVRATVGNQSQTIKIIK